jgi:hypothetical protein
MSAGERLSGECRKHISDSQGRCRVVGCTRGPRKANKDENRKDKETEPPHFFPVSAHVPKFLS